MTLGENENARSRLTTLEVPLSSLKCAEIEKEQMEFVDQLTNDLLESMFPFRTIQVSLAQLMRHPANHSTHHRGQVALMMRQLHAEPLATDFHVFLAEGRQEATAAR